MIAYLNDPHTRVYSPDEKSDWWQPRFVTVGMTIREIEGVPTVIRVEPGSSPARATIKPGDQIVSIDAVPVSEIISKKLGQLTSPPNKSARYRVAATLLDGEPGSSAQVLWRGKSGRLKAATFQRYLSQRELGYRIRRNDGYIVLEMQTFTRALVLEMVRELSAQLRGARGIILDLRSNGGGDAHAMASIASMFLGDGVALGKFTDRVGSNFELTTEARSLFVARAAAQTDIPMIALIGRSTSSAAEILASALQSRHRATLVGTGTCGCVLAIRSRHNLPDKGVLDVSEFDYRTAQGIRLEGLGVEPDDDSAPKRSDLYAKRDRSLETALEILKRNTKRQPLDTSLTR
jgi:carboxyl-terminal processing protease